MVFDSLPAYAAYVDAADLRYLYANQNYLDSFGILRDDIVGSKISDVLGKANFTLLQPYLESALQGKYCSYENIFDLPNHGARWIRISLTPDMDEHGVTQGIVVLGYDITEMHQAQEEAEQSLEQIRQSQDAYQALSEATFEAVFITDKGGCVEANRAASQMFGYEHEEMLGKFGTDVIADESKAVVRANMLSGYEEPYEAMGLHKDGHTFPLLIRGKQGTFLGKPARITVLRDISDRKKVENALKESEHLFRALFESSPIPICVQDFSQVKKMLNKLQEDGVDNLASHLLTREDTVTSLLDAVGFSYINPANLDLYKAKSFDQFQNCLNRLLPEKERRYFVDQVLAFWEGGRYVQDTARNLDMEGGELHLIVHKTLLPGYEDDWSRVLVSLIDITELTQSQKAQANLASQLQHAQKMEAIGTLAGGIAHDFNNLLAAIMGYSELAMSCATGDDVILDHLREVVKSVLRARDLVKQILTFSRKVESDLKPLNLNLEVRRAADMLKRTLPKMIAIELNLDSFISLVNADAAQIEQVLINLSTNAADAMPDGGTLAFKTRNLFIDREYNAQNAGADSGDYVLLEISDTGTGMSPEIQSYIFDPFFTTKPMGKGTGLGLSTAFGIIKEHEGYIRCESRLGKGTTFKILLPAVENQAEAVIISDGKQSLDARGGDETILLVDDEPTIRELGKSVLNSVGYKVITANSGEQALELYARQPRDIDLVVLDLGMPGMGGSRCMRELQAITPKIKLLISSGYSGNGDVQKQLRLGAVGYISKPYSASELLSAVRKALV